MSGYEAAQRLVQPALAGLDEIQVPPHQLVVPLDPAAPVEHAAALELERAEPLDEGAGDRLAPEVRPVEQPA